MSRSDSRRTDRRTPAPVRVTSERVSADELVETSGSAAEWADPVLPRVRPAGSRRTEDYVDGWGPAPTAWHPPAPAPVRQGPTTAPMRVLDDDHPSGPLHVPARSAERLPVLAPRPLRTRLRTLLRLVIRARRGGRHRSGAPHLKAWSMFEPHRNHPRRGRGAA